jgi:hypothetical protein
MADVFNIICHMFEIFDVICHMFEIFDVICHMFEIFWHKFDVICLITIKFLMLFVISLILSAICLKFF